MDNEKEYQNYLSRSRKIRTLEQAQAQAMLGEYADNQEQGLEGGNVAMQGVEMVSDPTQLIPTVLSGGGSLITRGLRQGAKSLAENTTGRLAAKQAMINAVKSGTASREAEAEIAKALDVLRAKGVSQEEWLQALAHNRTGRVDPASVREALPEFASQLDSARNYTPVYGESRNFGTTIYDNVPEIKNPGVQSGLPGLTEDLGSARVAGPHGPVVPPTDIPVQSSVYSSVPTGDVPKANPIAEQLGFDLPVPTASVPEKTVEHPLKGIISAKRAADKLTKFPKNVGLTEQAAAKASAAKDAGNTLRNIAYEEPGVKEALQAEQANIRMRDWLTKKSGKDPISALQSKPGKYKYEVLKKIGDETGVDLAGMGGKIKAAEESLIDPNKLIGPQVGNQLINPLKRLGIGLGAVSDRFINATPVKGVGRAASYVAGSPTAINQYAAYMANDASKGNNATPDWKTDLEYDEYQQYLNSRRGR